MVSLQKQRKNLTENKMNPLIVNDLKKLTDINLSPRSDTEGVFAGMALKRKDYIFSVIDSDRTVSARLHTRLVDIPLHSHNYVEMMYVASGVVTHIIDGSSYRLCQGQLLIMNRHVMHSIPASSDTDIAVNFIVPPEAISSHRFRGDESLRDLIDQDRRTDGQSRFSIYDVRERSVTENIIENLINDTIFKESSPDVIQRSVLRDSIALLFKYFELYPDSLLHSSSELTENDPLRKKIAAYIQNSFRTATLTELSELLKMTPTYVSRRVKELYGTSFTELLKERRFSEAEQLLLNGDLPVNAIAEAVGYENTSFFHRIFRQQYGVSPSKWRKEKKS